MQVDEGGVGRRKSGSIACRVTSVRLAWRVNEKERPWRQERGTRRPLRGWRGLWSLEDAARLRQEKRVVDETWKFSLLPDREIRCGTSEAIPLSLVDKPRESCPGTRLTETVKVRIRICGCGTLCPSGQFSLLIFFRYFCASASAVTFLYTRALRTVNAFVLCMLPDIYLFFTLGW